MSKYQLVLNKIGKFARSKMFELENETVFFGVNEAGKTRTSPSTWIIFSSMNLSVVGNSAEWVRPQRTT